LLKPYFGHLRASNFSRKAVIEYISRKNELLSLCRDQVDLRNKRLLLNRQAGKGGDPTEAPIYGDMSPWLDMQRTKAETISPSDEYLFIDNHGNRITDFRVAWNKACQLAGIPRLLFRDLRRIAARNMFRSGFGESTITRVAGVKTLNLLWRSTTGIRKTFLQRDGSCSDISMSNAT
jgi:integrase